MRALYASGVNIVCTYPGMQRTIAALERLDLLVVATDHLTPTAAFADFILPKTTLLEEEGVFTDPGGPCLSFIQSAVPRRGEDLSDMEIAIAMRDQFRAHGLIEYELLPWRSARDFIEYQLEGTGLDFDTAAATGFHAHPFGYEEHRSKGFATPSGKIELAASRMQQAGHDPLPGYRAPIYGERDDDYALTLLTGIRSMAYHHSRFRNHAWARKAQDMPELRIHPSTAARFGVQDDDWVRVEARGRTAGVYLQAWLSEDMPLDVVATGMGWWFPELAGADRGALKFNIEAAIGYGPPWDPITGSAEARNSACRITRVEADEVARFRIKEPVT